MPDYESGGMEFESPRALHNSQGVGKLGNPPALEAGDRGIEARLPDQFGQAAQPIERRASQRDGTRFET